jgi:hypothetical protein
MRKMLIMALAGFIWRAIQSRALKQKGTIRTMPRR